MPAKLTDLILTFQRYFNQHGDMQVVYRNKDNSIFDVMSCGLSMADTVNNQKVKVCWLSDTDPAALSDPQPDATQADSTIVSPDQ